MRVFIDGAAGTTGLQLRERLAARDDIVLFELDEGSRKDVKARREALNECDIAFLCLPDEAAREAADMIENPCVRVIDASTAHRTDEAWAYGFPELSPLHRAAVRDARRVSNPGCHASGFIACVYPLVAMGVLPPDYPLSCFSLTGYSGGGKKMIAQYEGDKGPELCAPRVYGLTLRHKHLPEMQVRCGLMRAPAFLPVVDDYYKGMSTTVFLHNELLPEGVTAEGVHEALARHYESEKLIKVAPFGWTEPMIAANAMAGRDSLQIIVCGNETHTAVTALFDNLGKGASGAAVQNLNIMMGVDETRGLTL